MSQGRQSRKFDQETPDPKPSCVQTAVAISIMTMLVPCTLALPGLAANHSTPSSIMFRGGGDSSQPFHNPANFSQPSHILRNGGDVRGSCEVWVAPSCIESLPPFTSSRPRVPEYVVSRESSRSHYFVELCAGKRQHTGHRFRRCLSRGRDPATDLQDSAESSSSSPGYRSTLRWILCWPPLFPSRLLTSAGSSMS